MTYGVKIIHTLSVGKEDRRFYEEIILSVNGESFEEAYKKAENYMQDYYCEYKNSDNETVKTVSIEIIDCFLAFDPEDGVQELYSSFSVNKSSMNNEEYYNAVTAVCDEKELRPLRNKDFN